MSILSALKAKGAKGKNIEEAIKTLPSSGGGDNKSDVLYVNALDAGGNKISDPSHTFAEICNAYDSGKMIFLRLMYIPVEYGGLHRCSIIPLVNLYSDQFEWREVKINSNNGENSASYVYCKCDNNDEWTLTKGSVRIYS